MKYNTRHYEDEIDRMRARKQRRHQQAPPKKHNDFDDFEFIEDLDSLNSRRNHSAKTASAKRHKRHKKKKWIFWICLLILLLPAFIFWKRSQNNGYWTVAIYGVDSRDGNLGKGALADVQILCSINRKTGEIRLASVFRDTYLKIDPD